MGVLRQVRIAPRAQGLEMLKGRQRGLPRNKFDGVRPITATRSILFRPFRAGPYLDGYPGLKPGLSPVVPSGQARLAHTPIRRFAVSFSRFAFTALRSYRHRYKKSVRSQTRMRRC